MLFNSVQFMVFFPLVTLLYFVMPHRFRWVLLLSASCLFYMAFIPVYILILGFTIVVDYFAGRWIENALGRKRKWLLILSLLANIGVLGFFKYYNFATGNLTALARALDWNYPLHTLSIILPIGLSFHTFQAMSYTIEVYRGNQKAEKHFGIYALYVMFYPQLVAGPIERPQNLLHQFHEKKAPDPERITQGLRLMLWGFFKKIAIADTLAVLVTSVYKDPQTFQGPMLLLATVCFSFQVYCDFSGYSDIAIGSARVMGIDLMKNFNRPYAAVSTPEFWRRWHISLSSWFKDYVFFPLGGSRGGMLLTCRNLMIVFFLSGLWHGAAWSFVLWGLLNGFYLVLSRLTRDLRQTLVRWSGLPRIPWAHHVLQILVTFSLIAFTRIFYRAESLQDAFYVMTHIFTGLEKLFDTSYLQMMFREEILGLRKSQTLAVAGFIYLMTAVEGMHEENRLQRYVASKPAVLRWSMYYVLVLSILFLGNFEQRQFIYFQF